MIDNYTKFTVKSNKKDYIYKVSKINNLNIQSENISFCSHPWSNLFLSSNGRIQPCCMNSTHLGNISKDTIADAWNGVTLQNIRKLVSEKRYEDAGCSSHCNIIYKLQHGTLPIVPLVWEESSQKNEKFKQNLENYKDAIKNRAGNVDNTPITLDIQPNESCNMKCIMCNQKHDSHHKITPEVMSKLFIQYEHIYSATFQGGEIFLYPNFTSFLIELKQKFSDHQKLCVITNASNISLDELSILTDGSNPVNFTISMDSIYEDTYKFIRKSQHFQKVMLSLQYLSKKQNDKKINFLRWNFVVMKSNFYQIKETIELAAKLGVEIYFQTIIGAYPDENIFEYDDLRDDGFNLYIDECIQIALKLNSKALNLNAIKDKLTRVIL